jgi:hypothetical protein
MAAISNLDFLMSKIVKDLPSLPVKILDEMHKRMEQLTQCGDENWYFKDLNFYAYLSKKLDFTKVDLRDTTGFTFAGFYESLDKAHYAFYQQLGDMSYMGAISLPSDEMGRRILSDFAEKDEREVVLVHSVLYSKGINMEKILLAEKSRLNEAKRFIPLYVVEAMINPVIKKFEIIGQNKSAI